MTNGLRAPGAYVGVFTLFTLFTSFFDGTERQNECKKWMVVKVLGIRQVIKLIIAQMF